MKTPPAYYAIPRERLNGRSAEMAFADTLYCLAAIESWAFREIPDAHALDMNFERVSHLSGLDMSTVNVEADNAAKTGWLRRTGMGDRDEEQVYLLRYAALANGHGAPLKPTTYVTNGWLNTVYRLGKSYLLQRALNVVWLMRFGPEPREAIINELRAKLAPGNKRSISHTRVADTVELLERLGLLVPESNGLRLNRDCFDLPAPSPDEVERRWDRRRLTSTELYLSLAQADPARAQLALDVLLAARFDPEHDLQLIFGDLRWVGDDADLLLLLARRRPKHGNKPGWQDFWRNFLRHRHGRQASRQRLRSAEYVARFDEASEHAGLIGLIGPTADQISELWLCVRLRGEHHQRKLAEAAGQMPEARFHLNWGTTELARGQLKLGKSIRQPVPLRDFGEHAPLHFTLLSYAPAHLKGVWLEAWLEAESRVKVNGG